MNNNKAMKNCENNPDVQNELTDLSDIKTYYKELKKAPIYLSPLKKIIIKFSHYYSLFLGRIHGGRYYTTAKYNIRCFNIIHDILNPLDARLSKLVEHKDLDICIDSLKANLPDSLKVDSTTDDIYNILKQLPKSNVIKLLREISPDFPSSEYLVHFFFNNDKEHFRETLLNGNYNLQEVKEFCDCYAFRIRNLKLKDLMSGKKADRIIAITEAENIANKLSEEKVPQIADFFKPENENNIFCDKMPLRPLYYRAKNILYIYFYYMDEYTTFEKEILDEHIKKIKRDPCCKKIYDKISFTYQKEIEKRRNTVDSEKNQEITSTEILEAGFNMSKKIASNEISQNDSNNNNEDFFIGEDYFQQQRDSDESRYFCGLKKCVETGGGTKFMELINWLATEGCIENTPETKATFAFRLTGIYPPKNFVEKIEWKGKAAYLFYIIKNFYKEKNGKGKKIEKFFSCKDEQFKKVACFSSYAKRGEETTKDSFLSKNNRFFLIGW